MFKIDMQAIEKAAADAWLMAISANPANERAKEASELATLANLAISHGGEVSFLADWQARGWLWTDDEIERFNRRWVSFAHLGLTDAESLAESLLIRDREADDRRMCVECAHLDLGRCQRPQAAGVHAHLGELATRLQRCPAFTERVNP